VPGASSIRDQDGPLNLAARLGLYVMLAGLVLASFVVPPTRPAQVSVVAPTIEGEPAAARIAPMSRGLVRGLRDIDDLEIPTVPAVPEAVAVPAAETSPEATVEPAADVSAASEPATTPEPTPKPKPTQRPTAPPVAALANPTTLAAEAHMLDLINGSRTRGGLVPLAMDAGVANTARAHSAAEAQVRYVYHDGSDGSASSRDVPACGTGWYGENTGKIWNDNVDALHIEFMAEPWAPINHRTNIMDPAFRRVGVGAVNGPDAMYMTMVFCR
jgi:uncharacterized protein YkwD